MAIILDGKIVRDTVRTHLKDIVSTHVRPITLTIIQVGDREDSNAYIKQKKLFGESIGVVVDLKRFPETVAETEILAAIQRCNVDVNIQGVIVQLPLPEGLDPHRIIEAIDPAKDVDGLTAQNMKLLLENKRGFVPATAKGVLSLLAHHNISVAHKHVVIVGRSLLVGKPLALSLLNMNATVTICHKQSDDLARYTKTADIVVVAAGVPGLITKDHVVSGQIIVDVGINVLPTSSVLVEKLAEEIPVRKIVGDVAYLEVEPIVAAISPVPGGVGPTTVAALFDNLVRSVVND